MSAEPPSRQAVAHASQELRAWLETLDAEHLRYAVRYADHLSTGEPEPDAAGLRPDVCAAVRRQVFGEWRRRVWAKAGIPPEPREG